MRNLKNQLKNFSTKLMREANGIEHIYKAINRLSKNHQTHMKYYGSDNTMRMSGKHETSSFDTSSGLYRATVLVSLANSICCIKMNNNIVLEFFIIKRPGIENNDIKSSIRLV